MAETLSSKRHREEAYDAEEEYHCDDNTKRHKSYNHILSILEQEEDETNQDLSDIFTSLQQELSSDSTSLDPYPSVASEAESHHQESDAAAAAASGQCSPSSKKDEEDDDRVRMMKHLLEASDDELGIPNRSESGDEETNSGEQPLFSFGDGLWEFEDDAANYYTLLQS